MERHRVSKIRLLPCWTTRSAKYLMQIKSIYRVTRGACPFQQVVLRIRDSTDAIQTGWILPMMIHITHGMERNELVVACYTGRHRVSKIRLLPCWTTRSARYLMQIKSTYRVTRGACPFQQVVIRDSTDAIQTGWLLPIHIERNS